MLSTVRPLAASRSAIGVPSLRAMSKNVSPFFTVYGAAAAAGAGLVEPGVVALAGTMRWSPGCTTLSTVRPLAASRSGRVVPNLRAMPAR